MGKSRFRRALVELLLQSFPRLIEMIDGYINPASTSIVIPYWMIQQVASRPFDLPLLTKISMEGERSPAIG